jgi:ABC-2 type transport system permease protein
VATSGRTLGYSDFFLAGVLSMACFGIAINTAYGFFVDRDNGIFYEFLTYPMSRAEFLVGKILFNCLLSIAQAALTIALGVLLLDTAVHWASVPAALAGVALGTAGWFFFLSTVALRIRRNDMFNTFINVAYFVLMFASSMFYPLDGLPVWLRLVAAVNPLNWHTDVLRFATVGVGDPVVVAIEGAAFLLFLITSFGFALATLRRGVVR